LESLVKPIKVKAFGSTFLVQNVQQAGKKAVDLLSRNIEHSLHMFMTKIKPIYSMDKQLPISTWCIPIDFNKSLPST